MGELEGSLQINEEAAMWTKIDATCSRGSRSPMSHRLRWQEDRLRLQARKTFLLEQLHRNLLPREAAAPHLTTQAEGAQELSQDTAAKGPKP